MLEYYITIICMSLCTTVIVTIQLTYSDSIPEKQKRYIFGVSCLIFVGALCELAGVILDGSAKEYFILHCIVKALEFTIAPAIPILFVKMLSKKYDIDVLYIMLAVNGILEFLSIKFKFIFYINENNIYCRGDYYLIYVCIYSMGFIIFLIETTTFCARYQQKNIGTIVGLVILLVIGLVAQIIDKTVRTSWLAISIVNLIFYMYYTDLNSKVDSLTNLLNRKSFDTSMKKLNYPTALIVIDANNFKEVNDQYGHQTGDYVLQKVSQIILKSYSNVGYCFRIGGDEFAVILKENAFMSQIALTKNHNAKQMVNNLNNGCRSAIKEAQSKENIITSLSFGYAFFQPLYSGNQVSKANSNTMNIYGSPEQLMAAADLMMYQDKANHKAKSFKTQV